MGAWTQRRYQVVLVGFGLMSVMGLGVLALTRLSRAPSPERSEVTVQSGDVREEAARVIDTPATSALAEGPVASKERASADASRSVDHVAALRRGLASDDETERIEAIEAAASALAVETLDELARFELKRDPEVAPVVIRSVALLGASAEGSKRDEAGQTLARWLRAETLREGADAIGNVSNLVEALGDVGGRGAADALIAALDGGRLPLAIATLAVMKLGDLGEASARGAVERFAARVAVLPPGEELDEELRVEAAEAARTTLAKI